jgi:hypothetical protein
MGKSISIAIDYNSYENRVIEDYLRDNADRIIRSLKLILIGLSRDTPVGLCWQLSMWMVREDYEVFKVWFTPDRFGIEYLYKTIHFPGVNYVDYIKVVKPIGIFNYWYKYRIEDIPENERYKFYWYPLTLEFNEVRAKLLEKVISEFENEFKEK